MSDVVAARIREVRKRLRLLPGDLAERCAELGASQLTENVIENIESGRRSGGKRRRDVTVDELMTLAVALNVAPVHLLVPPDDAETPYALTPKASVSPFEARGWIRGVGPLDDADPREFWAQVPVGEFYSVQQGPPQRMDPRRDGA